jgi:signal transduction histidine kinase
MQKVPIRNKKTSLWLALLVLSLSAFLYVNFSANNTNTYLINTIRKSFERKEKIAKEILFQVSNNPEIVFEKESEFTKLSEEEGIEVFTFNNDTPYIWTSNLVHPEYVLTAVRKNEYFVENSSTKAVIVKDEQTPDVVVLIKLSEKYTIHNKYIKNKNYLVKENFELADYKEYNASLPSIYFQSKEPAFSFNQNSENNRSYKGVNYVTILFFISLIIALFLIKQVVGHYSYYQNVFWLTAFVLLILLGLYISFTKSLLVFQSELFSPSIFAVYSWLSSLGELFYYSLVLVFFSFIFPFSSIKGNKLLLAASSIYFILLFVFSILSVKWLIENSSLQFDFSEISTIDFYSLLAILNVCLLFFSSWMFLENIILSNNNNIKSVAAIAVFSAIVFWWNDLSMVLIVLLSIVFPFVIVFLSTKRENVSVRIFAALFVAVSLFLVINFYSDRKEQSAKLFLAQKIASDNDPLAELLFAEMKESILKDKEVERYITEDLFFNKNQLQSYLKEKYFNGYWEKYIFQVTPCFVNDTITVQPGNKVFLCYDFFKQKATEHGRMVNSDEDLYIIDDETGAGGYLAFIEKSYKDESQKVNRYCLFIELSTKIIPEGSGYPELLLDSRYSRVSNNNNRYSFAKYNNGNIIVSSGNYKYPLQLPIWAKITQENGKYVYNGFNHFIVKQSEGLTLIVSSANYGFIGKITGFSYVFGILSLFYFLYTFYRVGPKQSLRNWRNFRTRIQILVAGTIVLATILFGAATIYYQLRQYEQQNDKIIREKLRSVLTEIEQKIGDKEQLTSADEEALSDYLIKFSNVFFTDLNIYDTEGELLASSRKNIFEMGLSSSKVNSFAYNQLSRIQNAFFIHREKIGALSFFSAYAIIKNDDGKTLGYLNIPYFARQDEMEKEISFFLGALINVYVVLFLLSVFVAIIISRLIAEPLQLIRSRLGDIALGKPNKPIKWESKDEIGLLINEYNRMIHQLEESAEKLARSERESAWREMARQVAHEIKNPLTPMKLSVQHLQRTYKESPEEFEQRLKKFTQNLVEQIDTLSNIANEFSDFAKMPRPQTQELDILLMAQQAIEFFKPTTKAHFILQKKAETTMVLADKDQMIRVFNNLLKNAVQAIENEEDGLIEVLISKESERIIISVRDNGNGIEEEVREKIFRPNFTTKTSGMGLGLAMVKNIINSHGGDIWFESEPHKGTTFFFTLPVVENKR